MEIEVKLPELGDGIVAGDVLEVLVKEGDVIKKDQGILEIETDKATVTLPSSQAGKVTKILVKAGDSVPVGSPVIVLEAAEGASKGSAPAAAPTKSAPAAPPKAAPQQAAAPAPPQTKPELKPAPVAQPASRPAPAPAVPMAKAIEVEPAHENGSTIPAGPAVRRFAREVGVDLRRVQGSGSGGRITREDVLEAVRQSSQSGGTMVATATSTAGSSAVIPVGADSDAWGPVRVEKMSKIRKTIANKMHESWSTVPRVTNQDDADVTELERIRQLSKDDYAKKGIKLTTLPFLIKSVAMALKSHPVLNASIDVANGNIIYKDYVNIGLAVDSDRGLVVPSLRQADQLSISEIARQVATLAENVRTSNFSIEDLRGSTFTISNMGAIGGTYSTPIINTPEVAILLVGRSRKMPVVVDDEIAIRLMMPLSLSYDHRLVDGAAAARFLNDVIGYLKAPGRLLLAP